VNVDCIALLCSGHRVVSRWRSRDVRVLPTWRQKLRTSLPRRTQQSHDVTQARRVTLHGRRRCRKSSFSLRV